MCFYFFVISYINRYIIWLYGQLWKGRTSVPSVQGSWTTSVLIAVGGGWCLPTPFNGRLCQLSVILVQGVVFIIWWAVLESNQVSHKTKGLQLSDDSQVIILPKMVEAHRIELWTSECKSEIIPFNYAPAALLMLYTYSRNKCPHIEADWLRIRCVFVCKYIAVIYTLTVGRILLCATIIVWWLYLLLEETAICEVFRITWMAPQP